VRPGIEPLTGQDRAAFSSGSEPLNRYLRQQADQDARNGDAAVFVLCAPGSRTILGYYTLAAFRVREAQRKHAAVLLGRLAVDERYAAQGWGRTLLLDALKRSLQQAERFAAVAVVVDAHGPSARTFYEHYGFGPLFEHEERLYLPMQTVEQLFRTRA
jgi:GNAT superfamily N-acetyltransferase